MSDNYLPWLFLLGVAVFVLYLRGWFSRFRTSPPPAPAPQLARPTPPVATPPSLENLSAAELGQLFVRKSRQEHEQELVRAIASAQHDSLGQIFNSPFKPPGEAPTPSPGG